MSELWRRALIQSLMSKLRAKKSIKTTRQQRNACHLKCDSPLSLWNFLHVFTATNISSVITGSPFGGNKRHEWKKGSHVVKPDSVSDIMQPNHWHVFYSVDIKCPSDEWELFSLKWNCKMDISLNGLRSGWYLLSVGWQVFYTLGVKSTSVYNCRYFNPNLNRSSLFISTWELKKVILKAGVLIMAQQPLDFACPPESLS